MDIFKNTIDWAKACWSALSRALSVALSDCNIIAFEVTAPKPPEYLEGISPSCCKSTHGNGTKTGRRQAAILETFCKKGRGERGLYLSAREASELHKVALGCKTLHHLLCHIGLLVALQGSLIVPSLLEQITQLLAGFQLVLSTSQLKSVPDC